MDERYRVLAEKLRALSSADAADHLLANYPVGSEDSGTAIVMIRHLSWEVTDQVRLADHYLSRLPHASAVAYEAFAAIMSRDRFLAAVQGNWPKTDERIELLRYYLYPTIRSHYAPGATNEQIEALLSIARERA